MEDHTGDREPDPLEQALSELEGAVRALPFDLPVPERDERVGDRDRAAEDVAGQRARWRDRAAPLLVVLGACTGGMYRQPQITLEDVRLGGLGFTGGTLLVDVKVVNPNRFALRASELAYDLRIRSTRQENDTTWVNFAQGVVDLGTIQRFNSGSDRRGNGEDAQLGFLIPARDSATVQIPVEFTYSGLGSAGATILRYGSFTYRAEGTVNANTPVGTRRLPFRRIGTVTLGGASR
jgi:hypothetical protein